ncbi:MAG: hypothetical protein LBC97_15835 [Bifidobacteriaceae bacterium]|jgi:hypothetical protein|nr:hypothetical protein [Bifidobacteriaceae bacterium]
MKNSDVAYAEAQWERYTYCRNRGHLKFIENAERCDQFALGQQWKEETAHKLIASGRPVLTLNKILPTTMTMLGEQIQNRTDILFRPRAGASSDTADALTKVFSQIAQTNQLQWRRSDLFLEGIVRGRAFYDVRIDFNDAMQGEVRITNLNAKNVLIDPDASSYDPDEWSDVFITSWMTWPDIAMLYGEQHAKALRGGIGSDLPIFGHDSVFEHTDRFGGDFSNLGDVPEGTKDDGTYRSIRVLERQWRKYAKTEHFVDLTTGDLRQVPENWDRERIAAYLDRQQGNVAVIDKKIKRLRWTVTAGPVVLHDDWSPYRHFTVVPFFPFFLYGRSVGVVENLISAQELLNKAASQELHIINSTANSGWVVKEGSLTNMTVEELEMRGAETGLILEFNSDVPPQKIHANAIPSGLDRVTYKAEEYIKSISNVSDSMQGFDREDVAAKAIALKQQRGSANLTKLFDNLERTDFLLASRVLTLIQSYYTEPRLLNITHDGLDRAVEEVQVNQPDEATGAIINDLTLGEFDIITASAPARQALEDSQFEQAVSLKQLGINIPDATLIENSRLMRRADLIKQMEASSQSPEAQAQREMQQRGAAAEVAVKEAQAQKTQVEAQVLASTGGQPAGPAGPDPELAREEMDIKIARLKLDAQRQAADVELERQRMEHSLLAGSEKLTREQEMKEQELAVKAASEAAKAQTAAQGQEESAAKERLARLREAEDPDATTP